MGITQRFYFVCTLLLLGTSLRAEVLYTAISPQHSENRPLSRFLIDLDQNNKADLALWLFVPLRENTFRVSTFDGHSLAGSLQDGLVQPNWISKDQTIDGQRNDWVSGSGETVRFSSSETGPPGTTEGFLAVRLQKEGGYHYGWIAVKLHEDEDAFSVTGYAFETVRDLPIVAGNKGTMRPLTPAVPGIYLADVADAGNASDFYLHFLPADDESAILEYRICVLPAGTNLDLISVPETHDRYLTIIPEGRDLGTELPANMLDMNGATIQEGQLYNILVWSQPRLGNRHQANFAISEAMQLSHPAPLVAALEEAPTSSNTNNAEPTDLPELPKAKPETSQSDNYPRVRMREVKLYGAGKVIYLKVPNEDWSPDATITVFDKIGQTMLAQRAITSSETVINMEMYPEGIYLIKANLNGTLLKRPLFLR